MRTKLWNLKFMAGLALVAGVAAVVATNGTAQETPQDVLIVNPEGGSPHPVSDPLDDLNLTDGALMLGADNVKRRVIAIKGHNPENVRAIHEAARALTEAEGDEARDAAKEKLTSLLDEYFERDMERREQELAEVEARVKKLRATLERRREKKRDIMDLQIEVFLNEANGLGFFGGDAFGGLENPYGPRIHALPGFATPQLPVQPVPPAAPVPRATTVAPPQAAGPARVGFGRGGFEGGYGPGGYSRGGYRGGYGRGGGGISAGGVSRRGDEKEADSGKEWEEGEREWERERERERRREREQETEREEEKGR